MTTNYSDQGFDYTQLLYRPNKKWFYKVKEVDRRLSHYIVEPSFVVCDVGGARGVDAFLLANKVAFVINLDINEISLRHSKERAKKSKLNLRLSFIRASAMNLPFKNEVLDLVTCFSTLDHLPDKASAFRAIGEFSRVVRRLRYVAITVPNRLFLAGTMSMKLKSITETDVFFEQRFTPKELWKILTSHNLSPILFDSEYPRSIGPGIMDHFPIFFKKIPQFYLILRIVTQFFGWITKFTISKLFGARMGWLSQKK